MDRSGAQGCSADPRAGRRMPSAHQQRPRPASLRGFPPAGDCPGAGDARLPDTLCIAIVQGKETVQPITYFVRMRAKPGQAERVLELLLENPRRIEAGEPGNIAFGVHRSTEDPNEFWLYETWESEAAVEAHESGEAFQRYKETLRPLVEPDSVIFGNTRPVRVLGYELRET